jgi:predicted aminopeptidase
MGEKITQLQDEREALRTELESLTAVPANAAEKPAGQSANKSMKRSEYDKLSTDARGAFVRAGGKVVED